MSTVKISIDLAPGWHEAISLPRVIPTGVHGALDYAASGFNLVFPSLLGLKDSPAASLMPRLAGSVGTAYSLLTDYELGVVRAIPMPLHLALDAAKGTRYWLPHVAVGTADVLASLTSKKASS